MNSKDKITSILDAINKINSSPPKKKPSITIENQNSIPKLNQSSPLPPDVDKLIREAEYYKKTVISSSEMHSHKNRSSEIKRDNVLILTEEFIDTPVTENKEIIKLKNEIKNLEKVESNLRIQILNLEKNNVSASETQANTLKLEEGNSSLTDTKETLRAIYKQVETQKKLFLDLKAHSIKIERDADVYRENYERLVIENSELKKKLQRTKEQIVDYETNKGELLTALDQLNEILSKNNIIKKISPQTPTYKKYDFKKPSKTEITD